MPKQHKRPDPRPPLAELIDLRLEKYGELRQREFAKKLGISRLHMTAIEMGRRPPSMELALRWLELLAPKARLRMFGPLPLIEKRVAAVERLTKLSPKFAKAA